MYEVNTYRTAEKVRNSIIETFPKMYTTEITYKAGHAVIIPPYEMRCFLLKI